MGNEVYLPNVPLAQSDVPCSTSAPLSVHTLTGQASRPELCSHRSEGWAVVHG